MNIYFLLEGRSTEKKVYQAWLQYLIPEFKKVTFYNEVDRNNYIIVSGNGYPRILDDGVPNAIDKIREVKKYNYLVICLDADEDDIETREQDVNNSVRDYLSRNPDYILDMLSVEVVPIIQNRCIETWFLGNRKFFDSRQPLESNLSTYVRYYDVSRDDPEQMGKADRGNHAEFHEAYLKEIFQAKKQTYSKKFPGDTQKENYLKQLIKRITDEPEHLKTFQKLIDFCNRIRSQLAE